MELFNLKYEDQIMSLIQTHFGFEVFTPGLERSAPLYQEIKQNLKCNAGKVITIAGTNGKGQTCHTLNHLLRLQNVNVAIWTSPHILSIRERFCYNNEQITYQELDTLIGECLTKIKKFDFDISFYEFLFFVFLTWINSKKVDFLLLEVGLGGKYDAVNHFDCDLALITSISRDHQLILGNRYDLILYEKLGITRRNGCLITAFQSNYLIELTTDYCCLQKIQYQNLKMNPFNYFESNINLAHMAFNEFFRPIKNAIEVPIFKGREEVFVISNLEIHFIGAHNPDGMRETFKRINQLEVKYDLLLFSFSKRENEDLKAMLKTIFFNANRYSKLYFANFTHPKAISPHIFEDVLRPICNNNEVNFIMDWKSFLNGLKEQPVKHKILVVGSYYFIGEIQRYLSTLNK